MIRGLVIGKFLPPHKGHLALISFAARQCDELIVSVSDASGDPIDIRLRLTWLTELASAWKNVKIRAIVDDFDRPELKWEERTSTWAVVINRTYGRIDKVFSSEEYGDWFAKHLGAVHVPFDRDRRLVPVAATLIRQHPLRYWDYIPTPVQPYFVRKICFYGAESTGKSTMALRMAEHYQTLSVPEVAREMITSNDFTLDDIIRIGKAQTQRVIDYTRSANRFLFCDTDLITTQIYSRHYLNVVPEVLYQLEREVIYDQYFFMDVDVPWVHDGLRDLGHRREEMRDTFLEELNKRNIPYVMVRGTYAEREQLVREVLDGMLA